MPERSNAQRAADARYNTKRREARKQLNLVLTVEQHQRLLCQLEDGESVTHGVIRLLGLNQ